MKLLNRVIYTILFILIAAGARGQSAEDVEEACGTTRSCKRMTDVGFDGLAEETDGDLRLAWRTQLAREGKLDPGAGSVRDLILGSES